MPAQQVCIRRTRWLGNATLTAVLIAIPASWTPAAPVPVGSPSAESGLASLSRTTADFRENRTASLSCPVASRRDPVTPDGPLLRPPQEVPPAAGVSSASTAVVSGSPAHSPAGSGDYRQALTTTALGWPRLERWCLWIEPGSGNPAGRLWEQRWQAALGRALEHWQQLLPIQVVDDPAAAQVLIHRRRPPLSVEPDGHRRASHGRATLSLVHVTRAGVTRLEPSVEVLLSPAQRESAIEATALHELGHAFGLWGHSDQAADAMATVPGAAPVLLLSPRDRATLEWLYRQPTPIGATITP